MIDLSSHNSIREVSRGRTEYHVDADDGYELGIRLAEI